MVKYLDLAYLISFLNDLMFLLNNTNMKNDTNDNTLICSIA